MQHDDDPIPEIDLDLDDQPKIPMHKRRSAPRRGNKKMFIIVAAVLLGLVASAVLWWFVVRGDTSDDTVEQMVVNGQSDSERAAQPVLSPDEAASISAFKNESLKLELEHRRDWTLVENADKTMISLTSPVVNYETVEGSRSNSEGAFTLIIRKGIGEQGRDVIRAASAARDSELVAYKNPTDVQRHYTNVSYGGKDGTFSFLVVTGDETYKTGEKFTGLPLMNPDFYLIYGGFGADPDGIAAFDAVPVTQLDNQMVSQATAIIESLRLF